ncbi:phospholipid carrier-dependent glycosyltransferase [Aristaeella lactis]|uniref:Dolichyl-phosphate-mannose--protein O-mannosyl transferase n=2 Tax=Aristaeella lactis TaxID=3046383 RepID=A0AC61PIT9_9FIRM|nr:phospholipid carrier-dependent glycosyltransferase [Aristaeella lactis]SMC40047.1 Dolichyl-phosphate-mannose--protein O-mannosyl transferase [Aristaeella lactis]
MTYKRFSLFMVLTMLIVMLFSAGCAAAENLLVNADFTEIDEDGIPEHWYTDAYYPQIGYSVFSTGKNGQEGRNTVTVRNINENDARFAQTVAVEPDSLYLLSGYISADEVSGGHGANLSVEGVYAFSEQVYDTDGEWQYIEYYGETGPEQHYITVFARLGGYSGMCTGSAAFSGLSLEKVDSIPDDTIADMWYRETDDTDDYADDEEYGEEEEESNIPTVFWLILISLVYAFVCLVILHRRHHRPELISDYETVSSLKVAALLAAALVLRMIISWFVEGYLVDVGCFLSWGKTMYSHGPWGFYAGTSFCDYPPLYTYILGLNACITDLLQAGTELTRVIYRFVPSICDLAGCWLIYRLMIRQKLFRPDTCLCFLALSLFNPATILNSAAWGQMDSALCLMLLAVALFAVKGNWIAALPLYVLSVLLKPQALMLGPLGLVYILLTFIRNPEARKTILIGTAVSLGVLALGVIPFSLQQDWDWLINLYSRTLASYPHATVNTANLYYLLGGNWAPVADEAHVMAPVLLCILCAGYGIWWYYRAEGKPNHSTETFICFLFSAAFIVCAFMKASWAWIGGIAMAFPFAVVISPAVRSRNIQLLPWLGGLLYILLYVFGIKMHERYVFPALLLLALAWTLLRDRRILYILLLFTVTVFINEGIVLDNSIRLGSSAGHLNKDTVWLADIISAANILGALYALWLNLELFLRDGKEKPAREKAPDAKPEPLNDRFLHWKRKDTILLTLITAVYAVISLLTLGSTKAPQSYWTSSSPDEQIIFDLGESRSGTEILYFAQVSQKNFTFASSVDLENWSDEVYAQMDQGQCWKWKYVTISTEKPTRDKPYNREFTNSESGIVRFSGRYIRLSACQVNLVLNEVLFRDADGKILPAKVIRQSGAEPESSLFSDPSNMLDEQDTMEGLPAFPETSETKQAKIQPSWWNSTYFDEIYHARTAYEFTRGTVPYETSHPPLGKVLMSLFVSLFGMTPFGWRFAGALAGIIMLPGMYLLGKQLTKKTSTGLIACLLMALDCMHLTQTQIATIDSFPVLFIIFAFFFMLRFMQTDYVSEKLSASLKNLALSGLFMGLSIASKWIGIYAGAGLAILFFWHCIRIIRAKAASGQDEKSAAWGRTFWICAWCIPFFIVVPVLIYLASYIPYMAYAFKRMETIWDYIAEVWNAQVGMFNYHSQPGLGMDHYFYSPWWQWPIIGKPMYYASQQYIPYDSPVHHSIFCFGNPVIWFGGLAALVLCIFRCAQARRYRIEGSDYLWHLRSFRWDSRYVFLFIGILAQYLPWVLVPRGTYIYHYFASIPFLMLAIALCFDGYGNKAVIPARIAAAVFIAAALVFFVILFPYACGINVPTGWLDLAIGHLQIWY